MGGNFPLYYQWFHQGEKVGPLFETILSNGDIYFMSDKAVGHDWKRPSIYTLRHAAGPKSCVGLDIGNEQVKKETTETKDEVKVKVSKKSENTKKDDVSKPKNKKSTKKVKEIEV